jgi:hypothetical protein
MGSEGVYRRIAQQRRRGLNFALIPDDRPPGSYSKTGVMSGLATIRQEPEISDRFGRDERIAD